MSILWYLHVAVVVATLVLAATSVCAHLGKPRGDVDRRFGPDAELVDEQKENDPCSILL